MIKREVLMVLLSISLISSCAPLVGCSQSHSSRTTTVETTSGDPSVTRSEESHEEVTKSHEHEGILSNTVHVLGEIIALPFRAVAALLRAIF